MDDCNCGLKSRHIAWQQLVASGTDARKDYEEDIKINFRERMDDIEPIHYKDCYELLKVVSS